MHPTPAISVSPRHARPAHPSGRRGAAHAARRSALGFIAHLWHTSPPLVAVAAVMLVVAIPSLIGIVTDPRVITGAPAWLKPFKFAISTAVYSITLAWVLQWLPDWPRVRRVVEWTTASVFVLEVAIIDAQAWRGTTSHFNVSTTLDAVLFAAMGVGILLQTATSVGVAVALWRQRFADRVLGWALRLGMTITIAGALTGGLMTRPTTQQLHDARSGAVMTTVGGHTVGARDGGPGLPVTGWSSTHGDLRVPHFIGLHALQVLGLVAIGLRRWRGADASRARLMLAASVSYAMLFVVLLAQALGGRSVVSLDGVSVVSLSTWAALTMAALGSIALGSRERLSSGAL